MTVEGDIMLDPDTTDTEELCDLFAAVAMGADDVERELLKSDRELGEFKADLDKERSRGAH